MDITTLSSNVTEDEDNPFLRHGVHVPSLVSMICFYLVILGIGIFASWRSKTLRNPASDDLMVAGRKVGPVIGIFTMTATWVGGGYINGTAEYVMTPGFGLVWCQAPIGYSISLILGGLFFAGPMRRAEYVTMLDPFTQRYGRVATTLLYFPPLLGDIFWSGAILSALGSSLTVIAGLEHTWAILIAAGIAVLYTMLGGLYSVVFTDVIQLAFIIIGLWLAVPFAMTNDAVTSIADTSKGNGTGWLGELHDDRGIGEYIDSGLLLIFGGTVWQVYYQRVLSQSTVRGAQVLSYVAGAGCIFCAIPAILIGAVAASTNWTQTDYEGPLPFPAEDYKLALPLVMQYLTPTPVAIIGLGAVSAAVMSSADSSIFSSASMFARNLYKPLREMTHGKGKVSDCEILWVVRVMVIVVGGGAAAIAIKVNSVYGLFVLCSDLLYVVEFPQLVCVLFLNFTNTYGALTGFFLGLFFRLAGGESLIDMDPLIEYPYYDNYQYFPYKTLSMLISFAGIICGSLIARGLFCGNNAVLPKKMDIFECFSDQNDNIQLQSANDLTNLQGKNAEGYGSLGNSSHLADTKSTEPELVSQGDDNMASDIRD